MEQTEILKEAELFYRSLYENKDDTLENINLEEYKKDANINKLTNEETEKQDL